MLGFELDFALFVRGTDRRHTGQRGTSGGRGARKLPCHPGDQPLEGTQIVDDLLALRAALIDDLGADGFDPRVDIFEVGGQALGARGSDRATRQLLIEPLHLVMERVEPGHAVFHTIKPLQIDIDYFERLFKIVDAVSAATTAADSADPEKSGRHDQEQRDSADEHWQKRQPGLQVQADAEGSRRQRHGHENDHVKHCEPS